MAVYEWNGSASGVFGTAGNWTPSGPPTAGDTAVFNQNATGNSLAGGNSASILLSGIKIYQGYTLGIGTRGAPLQIGCTLFECGLQTDPGAIGTGPLRVVLDFGSNQNSTVIINTGITTPDTGLENVRLKSSHSANTFTMYGGIVGLGTDTTGDTATFQTVQCSGGRLNLDDGLTTSTVTLSGAAQINGFCAITTLNMSGNVRLQTYGDYTITTATINGGYWTFNHRKTSGASITTLNRNGGTVDASGDARAFTIATYNEGAGTFKTFSSSQGTFSTTAQSNSTFLSRNVSLS